jgi:threonine/homoserine/homoserine lactone efflux protein
MINYFVFGLSYSFACVVQPGPFQAFLFSQSLTNGWRKTIPLVFAPLVSDLPVIVLVLFVLTNVPHKLLLVLQCLGGLFLLYLAFRAFRNWRTINQNEKPDIPGRGNLFKAVIVNLLNPNPFLGWSLVMGPRLIKGWMETPLNGIVLLIGFYGSMILYSIIMIIFFAAVGNTGPRINRILIGISVVILSVFGVYQLWLGMTAFF